MARLRSAARAFARCTHPSARSASLRGDADRLAIELLPLGIDSDHLVALPAELVAAHLGRCPCLLGSLADHAAFFLRDHCPDSDREPVGVGHIGRDEVDTGLFQAE